MANPTNVTCTADTWTKVATNVVTGVIWKKDSSPDYLQTYRETGGDAPTNLDDAVKTLEGNSEFISSSDPIDVYIYAVGDDGLVRVDL